MPDIRLIVNGDDFGISEEVNEGIIRAHHEGVLTSCSLMVTGNAFPQAVELARQNSRLSVGIHLVTVMGRSVLPKSQIPTLVDQHGSFSNNPNLAGLKYYFLPQARAELRKELSAQFQKFHSTGLRLSHIDGHLHMHTHPVIFRAAMELAVQYGAKRMRVPVEELTLALKFDSRAPVRKFIFALMFGMLGIYMKKHLVKKGFRYPERVYGNLQSGEMDRNYFLYMLRKLQPGASEIYFHPAYFHSPETSREEEKQLQQEFDALVDPDIKKALSEQNIRLINYLELDRT